MYTVARCTREGCYATVDCNDGFCKKHSKTKQLLDGTVTSQVNGSAPTVASTPAIPSATLAHAVTSALAARAAPSTQPITASHASKLPSDGFDEFDELSDAPVTVSVFLSYTYIAHPFISN